MTYITHIGLEIHVQLNTMHKIFCNCSTSFGEEPNSNVCPVCLGYPGVLPALNREAIKKAYLTAFALNCSLTPLTAFARKNYFYPDLPKNYQISQFSAPLGRDGQITLHTPEHVRVVGINEVHLEEDAGKMIHSGDISLIDYNRTGTPLLEIVTKPDLRGAKEAETLLQQMRQIVRYLEVSDGNMEMGSLRCDANISLGKDESLPPYKVEIKNMNSSRFVRMALEYEIKRQTALLNKQQTPVQETRLWNENKDITAAMRSKEEALDYRYFPEPDLPLFNASNAFITEIKETPIELPHQRIKRLIAQYHIAEDDARTLCVDKDTVAFFENCVAHGAAAQSVIAWLYSDVRKLIKQHKTTIANSPITAKRLAQLLKLLSQKEIHGKIAKQVLTIVARDDLDPNHIIEQEGWKSLHGAELRKLIARVMEAHADVVQNLHSNPKKSVGFLVGAVMKESSGQAHPQETQEIIRTLLS